jgi:hypothetical protein
MQGKTPAHHVLHIDSTKVAARIVGRSPAKLKRWRYEGICPAYTVTFKRVHYDVEVLLTFNEENTRLPSVLAAEEAERGDL